MYGIGSFVWNALTIKYIYLSTKNRHLSSLNSWVSTGKHNLNFYAHNLFFKTDLLSKDERLYHGTLMSFSFIYLLAFLNQMCARATDTVLKF